MRVLIDYRPALRDPSGVGEATRQLVKALAERAVSNGNRLQLSVFSSSWKDRLTLPADLPGVTAIDRRIPVRLLNFAWHRLEWPPAEWLTGAAYDVVHSPHPLLLPARAAAQVITIHDLHFLDRPDRTQGEIRRDYPSLVRRHALRADRIITPSRFTAQQVERRLGVPADRIAVCPHGAPAWPARTKRPTGGYVLFFGTLEPRKNVGGLLNAYERLLQSHQTRGGHPPELVLAGGATDEAQPWLDRIAQPPLRNNVRWIGYVNPSDRYALCQGARMLVLPSFEEGFGLPVIEAMTVGVPVVASNRGALPEVLGDAGPLVDPDDAGALAAAMDRMLGDEPYADACTARGLERARQFRWGETAQRVCEAYAGAIERHRAGRGQ